MVVLANSTKMCYTYDDLSRVTVRTIKSLDDDSIISTETFTYDAAGNITDAPDSCFAYDTNNRLITFCGNPVSYDLDGNMLSNGTITCTYDSANRLITAGGHTYTYNAEDVRIRNLCDGHDTKYTYDTNRKLSRLLFKDTNGIITKYVYGRGLIGEEKQGCCLKTYHFDSRGSTIAITDASGNITDTFKYDTYGKLIARTGTSFVIFGYNGRDGVVTDKNGLIYMRARYYSPEMKRFVNADIVAGEISNAVTLNRYAYGNCNPITKIDPLGLAAFGLGGVNSRFANYVNLNSSDGLFSEKLCRTGNSSPGNVSKESETTNDELLSKQGEGAAKENIFTHHYVVDANLYKSALNDMQKLQSFCNEAAKVIDYQLKNLSRQILNFIPYVIKSTEVELALGFGLGGQVEMNDNISLAVIDKEDFLTLRKEVGSYGLDIGQASRKYSGISFFGGSIGEGTESFDSFLSDEKPVVEIIEPEQNLNVGFDAMLYLLLGATVHLEVDIEYLLDLLVFGE